MRYAWRVSAVCVPLSNSPSGEPSTSRGPRRNTLKLKGGMVAVTTDLGAFFAPGSLSSCSIVTSVVMSVAGLLITTANCCAAAFNVSLIFALSRSTAKYSQPTLLRRCDAKLHKLTHLPSRQTCRSLGSQVSSAVCSPPVASHCMIVCPEQLRSLGSHATQASRVVEQIKPRLEQSSAS